MVISRLIKKDDNKGSSTKKIAFPIHQAANNQGSATPFYLNPAVHSKY